MQLRFPYNIDLFYLYESLIRDCEIVAIRRGKKKPFFVSGNFPFVRDTQILYTQTSSYVTQEQSSQLKCFVIIWIRVCAHVRPIKGERQGAIEREGIGKPKHKADDEKFINFTWLALSLFSLSPWVSVLMTITTQMIHD